MGGSGSSRWGNYQRKVTVEQCHTLDITELLHRGLFNQPKCTANVSYQTTRVIGEKTFDVMIEANTSTPDRLFIRLKYSIQGTDGPLETVEFIPLEYTEPHYGGVRFWFICPLSVDGQSFGRRVSKLFLPPEQRYFGCRHCYNLTYRKAQQHDKTAEKFRRNMWRMF